MENKINQRNEVKTKLKVHGNKVKIDSVLITKLLFI